MFFVTTDKTVRMHVEGDADKEWLPYEAIAPFTYLESQINIDEITKEAVTHNTSKAKHQLVKLRHI